VKTFDRQSADLLFAARAAKAQDGGKMMDPKIVEKETMIIAGVAGSGGETGKVWEAFMEIQKMHPLKNQTGDEGYEIRLYPTEGIPKIHVGVRVQDTSVPAEYGVFFLPAATYAEFEIFPSKGYESSNADMNEWLANNTGKYRQSLLNGVKYAVELYDRRYKGNTDPSSVVSMLVPIEKADPERAPDSVEMMAGPIREIGGQIAQFAGAAVSEKIMQGSNEMLAAADPVRCALWIKEAMDRLDTLTDKKTREQIMAACGRKCHSMNKQITVEMKARRLDAASEEEFLKSVLEPRPNTGARYERDGDTLIQYYTPRKYSKGLRCYCSLVRSVPEGVNASPTYCECSRAFVQAHWEDVLGRPVKVELGETAVTGSEECQFFIRL
jgi:predicted transcriptional regulator YdeE